MTFSHLIKVMILIFFFFYPQWRIVRTVPTCWLPLWSCRGCAAAGTSPWTSGRTGWCWRPGRPTTFWTSFCPTASGRRGWRPPFTCRPPHCTSDCPWLIDRSVYFPCQLLYWTTEWVDLSQLPQLHGLTAELSRVGGSQRPIAQHEALIQNSVMTMCANLTPCPVLPDMHCQWSTMKKQCILHDVLSFRAAYAFVIKCPSSIGENWTSSMSPRLVAQIASWSDHALDESCTLAIL